ncbi:MAG: hypothetical protein QOK37_3326 [Thermoanaerobaculia bacterium]|jgi:HPt (histidine-containing phosphotransfer) domain-containing protein|nr:hypothetical protein [Thermoanaerobaculia bacterium]
MSAIQSPRSSSHISRAELLDSFDGDAAFVDEIVSIFLKRTPLLLAEMRSALAAGDAWTASRAAHTIKGSIGYFDQGAAYAAAETIERMPAEQMNGIPDLLLDLEQRIDDLVLFLRQAFPGAC